MWHSRTSGQARQRFSKARQIGLGLAHQPDHGEDLHLEAELAGVDGGVVAADVARASSSVRTRRRQGGAEMPDPLGQFDIGHPPVGLQFGQDHPVDRVEFCMRHPGFLVKLRGH